MTVDPDSVDLRIRNPLPGNGDPEYNITRNFTYLTKAICKVRRMLDTYARVKKKKDWGIDPELQQHNPSFDELLQELPQDLQIVFPLDGSPPWLPYHFLGNLHSYYFLSIIMSHRPILTFTQPSDPSGVWKKNMLICYSAAKNLCRLQEGLLQSFGLTGLLCMQRGINFTIYCVLTCTILHLVCNVKHHMLGHC